jgi:hypothetical protein
VHAQVQSLHNGTIIVHVLGAFAALLSGNLSAVLAGLRARRLGGPAWYTAVSVLLGLAGLACAGLITQPTAIPTPPIFERAAVYSFTAWDVITGLLGAGAVARAPGHRRGRGRPASRPRRAEAESVPL